MSRQRWQLTTKQAAVLDYIAQGIQQHGESPTIRAIATRFSISTNGAFSHVKAIEAKGWIRRGDRKIVLLRGAA